MMDTKSSAVAMGRVGHGRPPPSSPASRILSGSVGSIVYVLAFTPLEVVKIRQQAALGSSSSAGASPFKAFHRGRGAVTLSNGLMLPREAFPCLVAPQYRSVSPTSICSRFLESISRHMLPQHYLEKKPGGILSTLLSISRHEGRAGLYAGLRPTIVAAVPNTAIYFTAYDEITEWLRQRHAESNAAGSDTAKQQVYIPLLAGSSARLISCVATAPLELVRTRQASAVGNSNSILEEFRVILRMHGPLALYRGLGPMILRDVPFSALYFLSLETFKNLLSGSSGLGQWGVRYYRERGMKAPMSVEVAQAFMSGGAAGAIATLVTTPFDVVKTRRQMVGRAETASSATGNSSINLGTFQHMRQIVQEEGFFSGLWKGNHTRMVKVAPGCAIMISCYELGKRILEDLV